MTAVKHPHVTIRLVGEDGNAFAIMGRATTAMRRAGIPKEQCDEYLAEAMSGDYDHLLATTMRWVTCDPTTDDEDW